MAESNGVSRLIAKITIEIILGKDWLAGSAIEEINPLGSSDLDLYKVDSVNEVK